MKFKIMDSSPKEAKMARKPEDEIELKLKQLEANLKEEDNASLPAAKKNSSDLSAFEKLSKKANDPAGDGESNSSADMNFLGGAISMIVGFVAVFSHIHVYSRFSFWGSGGSGEGGLAILGIVIGLGMVFYNYKNFVGWLVLFGTLAATILLVLSRLSLSFDPMNLFGLIFTFLPFALGGALIAKGFAAQNKAKDKSD